MNALTARPRAVHVGTLLILSTGAILVPLLPLELQAESMVMPDFLFMLVAAWILRRPESAPMPLVAALFLLSDLVLGRPPGLWALICLLATEVLRGQAEGMRQRPFMFEWLNFTLILAIGLGVHWVLLSVTLVAQPGAAFLLQLFAATTFLYPVCVAFLYHAVRIRAPLGPERLRKPGRIR